ncbi:MAG: hypothetical protein H6716_28630 [Polyangiaceae bacterium]|nr:hypothetical protein [Polyangiaceae bacterium]
MALRDPSDPYGEWVVQGMLGLDFSNRLRGFELKRVILSAEQWKACSLSSLDWISVQVCKTEPKNIPKDARGIYTFTVDPNLVGHPRCSYMLYVGKAGGEGGFRSRYYSYRAEFAKGDSARPLVNRMINLWYEYLWFSYAVVEDSAIDSTEDQLLSAYLPPINKEFPADVGAAMKAF